MQFKLQLCADSNVCIENGIALQIFMSSARIFIPKIVSEYDQEIPQSQTADNPVAPQGRAAQPSQDTRKTN